MKRLDRFILKAFLGPFVAILLVVMFILVMQFLWLYIDELVGKGLGFGVILEFLMWGGCTILPLALPLATLLSSTWTLGQLSENSELIAIKSAGISLVRILTPLFIASILICFLAFFASNKVVPLAYNQIYTLREDIGKTKKEIKIPSGIFYDGIDGYVLRVEGRNDDTGMMYGVQVYDHTGNKGNTSITIADSALMKMSQAKDYLSFVMYNGTNYQETNSRAYNDTTLELQRINFVKQSLIIPLESYSFEKSDSTRFKDQIKSMSIQDLSSYSDTLRLKFDKEHALQLDEFARMGIFDHYDQLDTSYNNKAMQDFDFEGTMKWNSARDKVETYVLASTKAENMELQMSFLNREVYEYQFYLRRADLEILSRWAQALACLILFFIGAPLGSLVRKGGLGIGAIVSALFFVLYWVVNLTGTKLAKDGAISASSGAFVSTYILAPLGAFLVWKAAHDSALFNLDQLKLWLKTTKSKIMSVFKKKCIVFMGTPEFAVASLDALIKKGYKVVGVVTVADKPAGRGLKLGESAVKKYAVGHGIPVLQPVKLKDPEFLDALRAWKADLFVVVAFRMLPQEVWNMPPMGTFNLHAALLPQYRGAAPINWAVINGEQMTGVTTFMLDKDIDTGNIIAREECRISEEDTAGDVHDRLMEIGSKLVTDTVESLINGTAEFRVQRSFIQGSEELKPAPKLTKELCHINWYKSTRDVYNLIRGLSPYPAAYTDIKAYGSDQTLQLKIFSAEKIQVSAEPGTIISDGRTYLAIATVDGAISIKELQLSGKKRMDVQSFLLGFRDPESWSVC